MHVLFIYPSIGIGTNVCHAITSLGGMLKAHGHKTDLFVLTNSKNINITDETPGALISAVKKVNPDLVAISLTSPQKKYTEEIIKFLKSRFKFPIVVGGVCPTLFPSFIEETPELDGLCRGAGEWPLLDYVTALEKGTDYTGIKNWWFRHDGKIFKNPMRENNIPLDEYPFPDFEIFPREHYAAYPNLFFARGCPFPCANCCNHALKKINDTTGSTYVKFKSVNRAMEEIKLFIKTINPTWLAFDDDSFVKNKKWLNEFCQIYPTVTNLPFHCNAFPSSVDLDLCKMLKKAGCRLLCIGIEAGDETVRMQILKRPLRDQHIIDAFRYAKEAGLSTHAFNMIGLPGETAKAFKRTVKLNKMVLPDSFQLSVFFPYEGTDLYSLVEEKKLMSNRHTSSYFSGESVLNLPGFSRRQIKWQFFWFGFNVYRRSNLKKALIYLKSNIKVYFPKVHSTYMRLRYG
ncbi:MAG: B12-binding domain-containing radical SAM protein [Oligoflexia bacterium]|nr:B12-binding domain-containing radical SAM protein [Oligoflexia bacterium]